MPTVDRQPWVGLLPLAAAAVASVEADTEAMPPEEAAVHRERVHAAAAVVDEWAAQVDRWTLVADRARAEAAAETAARALPGETPYQTQARLLGRGED